MTKYDYVKITIGYMTYVVPRKMAYLLFDAAQGEECYRYDTEWDSTTKQSLPLLKTVEDGFIKIESISPSLFHYGLERQRAKDAEAANAAT